MVLTTPTKPLATATATSVGSVPHALSPPAWRTFLLSPLTALTLLLTLTLTAEHLLDRFVLRTLLQQFHVTSVHELYHLPELSYPQLITGALQLFEMVTVAIAAWVAGTVASSLAPSLKRTGEFTLFTLLFAVRVGMVYFEELLVQHRALTAVKPLWFHAVWLLIAVYGIDVAHVTRLDHAKIQYLEYQLRVQHARRVAAMQLQQQQQQQLLQQQQRSTPQKAAVGAEIVAIPHTAGVSAAAEATPS